LDQRLSTIPQHTWVSKLFGFDLAVEYRPGKLNGVADTLSRRADEVATINAISAPTFELFEDLRLESQTDPQAKRICKKLQAGEVREGWSLHEELLLFRAKIFLPNASSLWLHLLSSAHDSGHEGIEKALNCLKASFYNQHMLHCVREYVRGCEVCQRNKTEHLHPAGLLQPLPVPSTVWSDILMDFIEGFPKVGGKSVILTIVDRFSKLAHFITLGHSYSAMSVAKAFFEEVVRLHGLPCSIVSGKDPMFTNFFWIELFKLVGVKLQMSSAFYLQSDGQSEVVNRVITMYLRYPAGDRPKSWLRWLPWAE
jgi:hypothetical protein